MYDDIPENDKNIPIRIFSGNESSSRPIPYTKITFPSGEIGIEFPDDNYICIKQYNRVAISAYITTPEEILELLLITNCIRNLNKDARIYLELPYIPFGRQDRHTTETSPWSLKVFADMLNMMKYAEVSTYTPHSNVSEILINNLVIKEPLTECLIDYLHEKGNTEDVSMPVNTNQSSNGKYKSLRWASSSTATSKKEAQEVQEELRKIRGAKAKQGNTE